MEPERIVDFQSANSINDMHDQSFSLSHTKTFASLLISKKLLRPFLGYTIVFRIMWLESDRSDLHSTKLLENHKSF